MKLVIVESPGKIKKISSYLGKNYQVEASFGHIRDLAPKSLSIDIENNFKPTYQVSADKVKVVKKLRDLAKKSESVILAADQDREGEAIAFSLKEELGLKEPPRIIFTEITKNAILKAIENPSKIDYNQVYAQQARRILDRLVGFQISPILWKHLPGSKSAGRVQSVLVRILTEHEDKIESSNSELRVKIYGEFSKGRKKINTTLYQDNEIKEFPSLDETKALLTSLKSDDKFYVVKIINQKNKKHPPPPFITSTLQQDASGKLRFPPKKTMSVAQKLYEKGLITYMRTDSTNLSKDCLFQCSSYIKENFGENYYQYRTWGKKSKNAQEAHEAIRPTKISKDNITGNSDEIKLYKLIWSRTVASQMADAIIDSQKINIITNNKSWKKYYFHTILNNVSFDGYLKVYSNNDTDDDKLLKLKEKDEVELQKITSTEDYQKPPSRMNEAGLIRYLEKRGIGRPSTYASLISKVLERNYVEIKDIMGEKRELNFYTLTKNLILNQSKKEIAFGAEKRKLVPTVLGKSSNKFLVEYFSNILEEGFTAHLEDQLDEIANGKLKWYKLLGDFYQNLKPIIKSLNEKIIEKREDKDKLLGEINNVKIYLGKSSYGDYVKKEENGKWKFSSIPKEIKPNKLTLEQAFELLKYPKLIGKQGNTLINLCKGPYGFYLKIGKINHSIKDPNFNPDNLTLEKVKELLNKPSDPNLIKTFTHKNKIIYLKKGSYGKYFQTTFKNKKVNVKAPKDAENLEIEEILTLVKNKLEYDSKNKKPRRKNL